MKKKVLALLLSGAMVVSLVGCGGSTEGTPAAAEETTVATTVYFFECSFDSLKPL